MYIGDDDDDDRINRFEKRSREYSYDDNNTVRSFFENIFIFFF